MKMILVLLAAVLITASKSIAGSNVNDFSPAKGDILKSYTAPSPDTVIVPMAIRTTFNTKYPNATSIKWYHYMPDKTNVETTAWYYILDTSDYYVSFNWDGDDYIAWYDNGTWIRSQRTVINSELPLAVRRAITAQYPDYVITDIDLEYDDKMTLYEVDLEKGNKMWNIHYTPDGQVIKKKERTLSTFSPEADMVTDFESRFPNASNVTWYYYAPRDRVEVLPTDWDYDMESDDYEVHFRYDGADYVAWYDEGKWVRSEVYTFDASKLPTAVNNAIRSNYSGYKIEDVDREQEADQTIYEVELSKGNDKCKVHYTADGTVLKKKCKKV